MKITSEQEMLDFGKRFAAKAPRIIELVGDVGAGKTTFTRGLAMGLGVTEPVTSPSFTIMKSYPTSDGRTLVHYDFYRLPDPGLMADDLLDHLANPTNLIVVEWANTVENLLPPDRTIVSFAYTDDGFREVTIK